MAHEIGEHQVSLENLKKGLREQASEMHCHPRTWFAFIEQHLALKHCPLTPVFSA